MGSKMKVKRMVPFAAINLNEPPATAAWNYKVVCIGLNILDFFTCCLRSLTLSRNLQCPVVTGGSSKHDPFNPGDYSVEVCLKFVASRIIAKP